MMTQTNGSQSKSVNKNVNLNQIEKIRISIVDDSRVIREGLRVTLETETDFDIVGMANDGKLAIELIKDWQPDIVIMDIEIPQLNGIVSTQVISERFTDTKVVIYSNHAENSYISQSLEAGAKGYFLKQTPVEEIVQGIKNVHKGFCQFSPGLLESYVRNTAQLKAQSDNVVLQSASELETSFVPVPNSSESLDIQPKEVNTSQKTPKRIIIWTILTITSIVVSGLAIALWRPNLDNQISPPLPEKPVTAPIETPTAVSALGRIEPEGEVIELSVSSAAEGSKIEELLVERGDTVQRGQVVAILDNYGRQQAVLESAKADVQTAIANLERVQAGAKQGDINAQQAAINRLEAELRGQRASQEAAIARFEAELKNAEVEYRRYQQLAENGAISDSERDTKRLRVDTVRQQLSEARETLNRTIATTQVQRSEAQAKLASVAEVRDVDVRVAQAELEQARGEVKQAEQALALTKVRSPINGQILTINVRPGEVVGDKGIMSIGQTAQMYVVAEVYETDVEKVRLGQKAIITGTAFSEKLQGEVSQIGLEVKQQDVFESDPLVNTDNKVVEVKIRLSPQSSQKVATLSNLQVEVVIGD
jgi:HlyD family secretion protein